MQERTVSNIYAKNYDLTFTSAWAKAKPMTCGDYNYTNKFISPCLESLLLLGFYVAHYVKESDKHRHFKTKTWWDSDTASIGPKEIM
jgi:hypothetical protein